MAKDKKIKQEELENTNGGNYINKTYCPKCQKDVVAAYRYIGEGCDQRQEFYCPDCGTILER